MFVLWRSWEWGWRGRVDTSFGEWEKGREEGKGEGERPTKLWRIEGLSLQKGEGESVGKWETKFTSLPPFLNRWPALWLVSLFLFSHQGYLDSLKLVICLISVLLFIISEVYDLWVVRTHYSRGVKVDRGFYIYVQQDNEIEDSHYLSLRMTKRHVHQAGPFQAPGVVSAQIPYNEEGQTTVLLDSVCILQYSLTIQSAQ